MHRFEWGYITHPGVWACGGGRQDIPPVLVGITFQVPQKEPEYAWWCYLGPRPEFENEFDPDDKDKRYLDQCRAIPQRITKNMGIESLMRRTSDLHKCKVELIEAAIRVAEHVEIKAAFPLEAHEQACLKLLKRAATEYKETQGQTALVVDCPDCGGGDSACLYCYGEGTVIE